MMGVACTFANWAPTLDAYPADTWFWGWDPAGPAGCVAGRAQRKKGAMIACVAGVAPSQGVGLATMHDP